MALTNLCGQRQTRLAIAGREIKEGYTEEGAFDLGLKNREMFLTSGYEAGGH